MRCGWRHGLGSRLSTRDGVGFRREIKGKVVDVQGSVTLFERKIAACRAAGAALGFCPKAEE